MTGRVNQTADVIDLLGRRGRGTAVAASDPPGPDEFLSAAATGDETAFARFYDLVIGRVYGVIVSVLRDPAQSEEVTQEVMLELWRTAPRFETGRGSATTWALTIAHRRAVDRVRSEQSRRHRDDREVRQQSTEPAPDPAVTVMDRLDRERVVRALEELTEAQRQSIELAYFGGHTHAEVAALLDLPLGTVKTRIRDGLVRLRDRLEVQP